MTDKPIADLVREIEELDQKATPEPWVVDDRGERVACLDANAEWICETHGAYLGLNADLIVALRNAWPRLRKVLAERDSLKAENEKLREVAGVAKAASRYCHGKIGERAWNDQHCGYQNDDDGAWIYGCQDCASWGPLDAALAELEKR